MSTRRGSSMSLVALLLVGMGCASGRQSDEHQGSRALRWPRDNPRIELDRVIKIHGDLGGSRLRLWLTGKQQEELFARPFGVAWDGEDILVADPAAQRVLRIDSSGHVERTREGLFVGPIGIARCEAGIVVSDSRSGRVALLGSDLRLDRWIADGLHRPTGVGCVGGEVLVVETGAHALRKFPLERSRESAGGAERLTGSRGRALGDFNFPTALAVSGETVWVGDTLNFRLQAFDARTLAPRSEFGSLGDSAGNTPRVKGVAVDRAGNIWVSDAYLDQVALYTRDGVFLLSLGRTGLEPGEFSFPAGVAASPDGRIVVADSLNRRLQVFRLMAVDEELDR